MKKKLNLEKTKNKWAYILNGDDNSIWEVEISNTEYNIDDEDFLIQHLGFDNHCSFIMTSEIRLQLNTELIKDRKDVIL